MIRIKDKSDCCGCWACVQKCPKSCISMQEDPEGFLYPHVETSICINCGLCEKVCPVINQQDGRVPLQTFAAKNLDDEVRLQSSSGGFFSIIASYVIQNGGIVFGAKFNDKWEVIHSSAETETELNKFRGSKYVQSQIKETYSEAETYLKQNKIVLFSGTPCQIAGLKLFLRKEYNNLITVDFICHGVPSPKILRNYLNEVTDNNIDAIKQINFRDKSKGWKLFSFKLTFNTKTKICEDLHKNPYLKGFLSDLYLRPSCHKCPTKSLKSGSDITIGDFWGVHNVFPNFDDDKGVSAISINSPKGEDIVNQLNLHKIKCTFEAIKQYNPALYKSSPIPPERKTFWESKENSLIKRIREYTYHNPNIIIRAIRKIFRLIFKSK